MISIVVAYGANRGIGYRGGLPWRLPSDLRRFRELTIGGTVLMGRKTFESLPDAYRPLPGRRNLVLSGRPDFDPGVPDPAGSTGAAARRSERPEPPETSVEVHGSIEAALAGSGEDCFVIGGGSIYEQALPLVQRVYATLVQDAPPSDTFFPELDPDLWQRSECSDELNENGHRFRFAIYDRLR